jgi:hypothetical protein
MFLDPIDVLRLDAAHRADLKRQFDEMRRPANIRTVRRRAAPWQWAAAVWPTWQSRRHSAAGRPEAVPP